MTYPTVDQVLLGVVYGASNELTGTLVRPAAADVRLGTAVGESAHGTLALPLANQVRNGVTFDAAGSVTGTLSIPQVGKVLAGFAYGAGGTEFVGSYAVTLPLPAQVLYGVNFGDASVGTVVLPSPDDVQYGIHYGPSSNSVGLFTGEGGSIPTTGDIVAALLAAPLVNSQVPGSIGEALQAAWSSAWGNKALLGTQLRFYGQDGTTLLKAKLVNDATNPTIVTEA